MDGTVFSEVAKTKHFQDSCMNWSHYQLLCALIMGLGIVKR